MSEGGSLLREREDKGSTFMSTFFQPQLSHRF